MGNETELYIYTTYTPGNIYILPIPQAIYIYYLYPRQYIYILPIPQAIYIYYPYPRQYIYYEYPRQYILPIILLHIIKFNIKLVDTESSHYRLESLLLYF